MSFLFCNSVTYLFYTTYLHYHRLHHHIPSITEVTIGGYRPSVTPEPRAHGPRGKPPTVQYEKHSTSLERTGSWLPFQKSTALFVCYRTPLGQCKSQSWCKYLKCFATSKANKQNIFKSCDICGSNL